METESVRIYRPVAKTSFETLAFRREVARKFGRTACIDTIDNSDLHATLISSSVGGNLKGEAKPVIPKILPKRQLTLPVTGVSHFGRRQSAVDGGAIVLEVEGAKLKKEREKIMEQLGEFFIDPDQLQLILSFSPHVSVLRLDYSWKHATDRIVEYTQELIEKRGGLEITFDPATATGVRINPKRQAPPQPRPQSRPRPRPHFRQPEITPKTRPAPEIRTLPENRQPIPEGLLTNLRAS